MAVVRVYSTTNEPKTKKVITMSTQPTQATSSSDCNFYGVYLLYCTTPQFNGDTYIGFTVDPVRRIKQHNRGVAAGGAYATNRKGSWEMTLVVHGFPNDKSALRFEWSWQHPKKSRRLAHVPARRYKKESKFEYALRVLSAMLTTAPWKRLSLTVQWLIPKYIKELPVAPPPHMPIIREEIDLSKYPKAQLPPLSEGTCSACSRSLAESLCSSCTCGAPPIHLVCLAKHSLQVAHEATMLIPVWAHCSHCNLKKPWNSWIRENVCQVVGDTEEV